MGFHYLPGPEDVDYYGLSLSISAVERRERPASCNGGSGIRGAACASGICFCPKDYNAGYHPAGREIGKIKLELLKPAVFAKIDTYADVAQLVEQLIRNQ